VTVSFPDISQPWMQSHGAVMVAAALEGSGNVDSV
jgi:hypothetical protein